MRGRIREGKNRRNGKDRGKERRWREDEEGRGDREREDKGKKIVPNSPFEAKDRVPSNPFQDELEGSLFGNLESLNLGPRKPIRKNQSYSKNEKQDKKEFA